MKVKDIVKMPELQGAVARGWCHPKNSNKIMDSDLAFAIADEIGNLDVPGMDENKVFGIASAILRKYFNDDTSLAKGALIAEAIVQRFPAVTVPTTEDIEEVMLDSTLADACVFEAYAGDVRELATAIRALMLKNICPADEKGK